ncbi:uncharacterized protein [Callorhinus ursinus]|uniref:uncharacterized protein n=1 Tax=Callorhinus ursinus TaxID=34884 RepID=UPI003CD001EB
MQSGLAGSAFGTTVNYQTAFGDKTGVLPIGVSTTTGSAVATGMPSAGLSSFPLTLTTPGPPVFTGTAAPIGGGSFGFGVSVPGPAHSQASGALNYGAGLNGAPSTTSAPLFGPSQYNMAAAVGGASTVPGFGNMASSTLNPGTWGQPTQNTGGALLGKGNNVPTVGGSSVPTTPKCTLGSSKRRKPAPGGRATTEVKRDVSRDTRVSPLQNTWGSPGHTTSVAVASTSTNYMLQPTSSSHLPPSTSGPPAQHTGGVKDGNNITPKTGNPGIPALHQRNSGPPDANTGGTAGKDIVSMMAGLSVTSCPQNTRSLPSTKTGGAMGISTTSTTTGNTNGPPCTQTTWSTPNHSTDGSMGDSPMEF